jgi:glycosyltransferase involved in cell wall biosynthesis
MLSVIIATLNSERALVPTLSALVPGATAGLVSEVVIADGGSKDDTAAVADIAGCNFLATDGALGKRLKAAAAVARAPWLLFLRPGIVLDAPWIGEAGNFIERGRPDVEAAVFQRAVVGHGGFGSALAALAGALVAKPRPEQGLIVAKRFYQSVGGHSESAADPEADFLRRIGRRRIATLAARAFPSRYLT